MTPILLAILAPVQAAAVPMLEMPPPAAAGFIESLGEAATTLRPAIPVAERILAVVRLAVVPAATDAPSGWARGATLARYAAAETGDPARLESTRDYSRRTLAGKPAERLTTDDLIGLLTSDAELVSAACAEAETRGGNPAAKAAVADLRVIATLGRFHALRLKAAVHYNLFLRAQRLAELVAATYVEKDAVILWKEVMNAAAAADRHGNRARPLLVRSDWAADLARLDASARDLEAQCCPPAPDLLKERTWQPAAVKSTPWPKADLLRPAGDARRAIVRLSTPAQFNRATLFMRAKGEAGFRTIPLSAVAGDTLSAELPTGTGRLEGFLALEGPEGIRFSPAPWDRPAFLTVDGP